MHAAALHVLRTAHRPISRRACRVVGGSRHPLSQRNFHRSTILFRTPDDAKADEGRNDNDVLPEASEEQNESESKVEPEAEPEALHENAAPDTSIFSTEGEGAYLIPKLKKPGSGRIRGVLRSKATEGVPPISIPTWFWEKNVKLVGEADLSSALEVTGEATPSSPPNPPNDGSSAEENESNTESNVESKTESMIESNAESTETLPVESSSPTPPRYSMHGDVYKEILTSIRSGLILTPPKGYTVQAARRPFTLLQCPKEGGTMFLDSVVETVAAQCDADLIRLDAQDIAEVVGPYIDEEPLWSSPKKHFYKTGMLAYRAHKLAGRLEEYEEDAKLEKEVPEEEEAEEDTGAKPFSFQLFPFTGKLNNLLPGSGRTNTPKVGPTPLPMPNQTDQWNDLKLTTAFDIMVSSADAKRAASSVEMETSEEVEDNQNFVEKALIVQLKDCKEIMETPEGGELISKLRTCVDKRWHDGRSIVLVGTSDMLEGDEGDLMRSTIQHIQSDVIEGNTKTILVVPNRSSETEVEFESDEKARYRDINIRHVEHMIVKLAEGVKDLTPSIDLQKDLDTAVAFAAGIEDAVWTYSRVHRIATTILGLESDSEVLDGAVFSQVLGMLSSSDDAKVSWATEEKKREESETEVVLNVAASEKKKARERIKKLRKRCNPQEAKMLNGVVFPPDIRTTFADIRAPEETIDALKTLTSLSLTRPEAFKYGVLATDKIPGLLLYGPPGTGKTLLAKAVAKESGATVLEITAADLNDMYVGQGEKNVRAVFSLAKKLSPCVVFIDEADAIFASRHEGSNRAAHREMINQFLREWDGLTTDTSAFIMVATNRPFDIDEAVLRRLPRRILVDLPVEKDREAILRLNLRGEIVDESVSVEQLAKDTPFYSGSDLKNVVVAAALACIREENDLSAKHTGEEPFVFPEKRILTKKHFEKAIEEISASISEDMSTLSAIRKFDEKYGDRKGRRKKGPGLGFGGTKLEEKDSEAVRVRKMGA